MIDKVNGLKALAGKLKEMNEYLTNVISGRYRYNQLIMENFQVSLLSTLNPLFRTSSICFQICGSRK